MILKKKLMIIGAVFTLVLMTSTAYLYLYAPPQSIHLALLSESQAEGISGQKYDQSLTTILRGNNLSYGEKMIETVTYSNISGSLHVEVLEFKNQSSSQFIYSYLSSHLNLPSVIQLSFEQQVNSNIMVSSSVTSANSTLSETYKGFNYTYLVKPMLITFNGNHYIWDTCGMNVDIVFYLWGNSPSPPHSNMSAAAKEQIDLMTENQ